MENLTKLERQVLDDITKDDFYEDGLDSAIWADYFLDTTKIPSTQVRGVLASLIKKDLIKPIEKGRDGVIRFTEKGKDLMRSLGYK